ncbi:MAG: S24 family peptidase [Rhodospirillaceae bacterium]|nr:S24 family peptidase [Rhodospirillaceae bacterium]
MLTQLDLDPEHCRAVEALDDSMAPRIPAASVTLADFRRREPRDGGIFVIGPERSPTLRQLTSVKKSWMAEAVNPMWPARRISKDEILGEGLWRSMALPPGPMTPPARDPGPTVSVTQMQTEGLKPWPVPYRSPGDPLQFEPDRVAWFEVGFLHALQIEPLNAEVVIVTDSLMMPTLWPSAAVLINRRRTAPRDGMICGLWSGGTVVPRRLISDETGWRVAADAPAAPTRPLRLGESIVGEAVWTGAFLPGGAADRENE